MKIVTMVLLFFAVVSGLHVWLNIGLDRLGLGTKEAAESRFRIGFLPVT